MRKLREKLNKKGFTLVELIVVIVIVLILAAVLVPNVMQYISDARKSAFQAEASGYLTEIQALEAKYYATESKDLNGDSSAAAGGFPTGYQLKSNLKTVYSPYDATDLLDNYTTSDLATPASCKVSVAKGVVYEFTYQDGKHFVSWSLDNGWTAVDSDTWS